MGYLQSCEAVLWVQAEQAILWVRRALELQLAVRFVNVEGPLKPRGVHPPGQRLVEQCDHIPGLEGRLPSSSASSWGFATFQAVVGLCRNPNEQSL